jgi:hypothetical protein
MSDNFGCTVVPPSLAFGESDVAKHWEAWGFNCGPAALCAILGLHPAEVRGKIPSFEQRQYTNPTMMVKALKALAVGFEWTRDNGREVKWPRFGVARIQWDGPWIGPGVPMQARYRHSHWVATMESFDDRSVRVPGRGIYDINCPSHFCAFDDWKTTLVPYILRQYEPKANGGWWVTDAIEVLR